MKKPAFRPLQFNAQGVASIDIPCQKHDNNDRLQPHILRLKVSGDVPEKGLEEAYSKSLRELCLYRPNDENQPEAEEAWRASLHFETPTTARLSWLAAGVTIHLN